MNRSHFKQLLTFRTMLVILTAILIGLTAGLTRFWQLGSLPRSLYWDEMAILVDAKSLLATGLDHHGQNWLQPLFLSYGDYKLPVFIWLVSLSGWLFGLDAWSLRLVNAVIGLLTILITSFIAYSLAGAVAKKSSGTLLWSLSAAFVVTLSPWAIVFSRTGFEAFVGQFFLTLSVAAVFVSRSIQQKSSLATSIFLLLSVLSGSIATYSYFSVRFVWPFVWAGALIVAWSSDIFAIQTSKKSSRITGVLVLVVGLLLYWLTLQPMVQSPYYEVSNQFRLSAVSVLNATDYALESNQLRAAGGNGVLSRIFYHRHWLLLRAFLQNLSQNLSPTFWFVSGDQNLRHGTGQHGLYLLPFMLPLLIGSYHLAKKTSLIFLWLTGWILVSLVPASVPLEVPHGLRSLNALVPSALLIGWGVTQMVQRWSKWLLTLFAFVIALFFAQFLFDYFGDYPDRSSEYWQATYPERAQYYLDQSLLNQSDTIEVQGVDDRFYLWVLANDRVPGNILPELEKKYDKVTHYQNIVFE